MVSEKIQHYTSFGPTNGKLGVVLGQFFTALDRTSDMDAVEKNLTFDGGAVHAGRFPF